MLRYLPLFGGRPESLQQVEWVIHSNFSQLTRENMNQNALRIVLVVSILEVSVFGTQIRLATVNKKKVLIP